MPSDLDVVNANRYVSLTTFRRTGAPVSSPVWVARDAGELVVITVDPSGKLKRLAHTARVALRPCDIRGRVPEGGAVVCRHGRRRPQPGGRRRGQTRHGPQVRHGAAR